MNELALFSGAGGGILGTRLLGFRVVCAVEIDPYCREVLLRRQEEGHLEPFPVWDDVRTFDGKPWRGIVDVVTAGFPCQPFSVAGRRKGESDDRNLWPETIRVLCEVRPRFALLENVPGLLAVRGRDGRPYFGRILGDLAEGGFDAVWRCLSAAEVGTPHRRDRLWILAYAQSWGWTAGAEEPGREARAASGRLRTVRAPRMADAEGQPGKVTWWAIDPADLPDAYEQHGDDGRSGTGEIQRERSEEAGLRGREQDLPDAQRDGLEGQQQAGPAASATERDGDGRPVESRVGRVADGVAYRVDRLRALGNGQVPAVVAAVWRMLTDFTDG